MSPKKILKTSIDEYDSLEFLTYFLLKKDNYKAMV